MVGYVEIKVRKEQTTVIIDRIQVNMTQMQLNMAKPLIIVEIEPIMGGIKSIFFIYKRLKIE